MTAPRLEIDLDKIYHSASTLVKRLACRGISVTGMTKATLGSAEIAATMLPAGVNSLGDSRVENIEAMRLAQVPASMTMIRSPMLSQAKRVVMHVNVSCNTEIEVIRKLSLEAQKADRIHGVILMVELGDLREGIIPDDLTDTVRETLSLPNIVVKGITSRADLEYLQTARIWRCDLNSRTLWRQQTVYRWRSYREGTPPIWSGH